MTWWRFRDLLCRPFGHVLYAPRGWRFWAVPWGCACRDQVIGVSGCPPWRSFKLYWRFMRRPAAWCGPDHLPSCACRGRGWVRQ